MNPSQFLRSCANQSALLLLMLPAASGVAHAVLYKDTPIYHQAMNQAVRSEQKGGLGMPEAKAKKFAMSVAAHSKTREVLPLYLAIFSHFDLENPAEFEAAKSLSEELSRRSEAYCAVFQEAFDFAHNPVSFLDAKDAAVFARSAAELPPERIAAYKAAYSFGRGTPYYLTPAYAILFANSAGNHPGMLERYRFAFSNILENTSAGFQASLSLAEDLSELSAEGYRAYLLAFYSAVHHKQNLEEALATAKKTLPDSAPPEPKGLLTARALPLSSPPAPPMLEYRADSAAAPSSGKAEEPVKAPPVPAAVRDDAASLRKSL